MNRARLMSAHTLALVSVAIVALSTPAWAQTADYGSFGNFDDVNHTGKNAHSISAQANFTK